jgi:hypothetical protein
VSVGDGTDPSTQVPVGKSAWVPTVLSYHGRLSMLLPFLGPALIAFPGVESP